MTSRIVFAYAGGLEAAMAIPWLAETYGAEVIALTLDLGQGQELEEVRDRALAAGASRAHVLDVREEFTHGHVLPALQAGAVSGRHDPMALALAYPLIAKKLVEIAAIEEATTVAHGCSADASPFVEGSIRALDPRLDVVAAGRDRGAPRTHGNLWGRSMDHGHKDVPEKAYRVTRAATSAPDAAASVEIAFQHGVPTAINGVPMPLTELIESLGVIAGQHGVGRIGPARGSTEVHEAPAAVVLHAAHKTLETRVLPKELRQLKRKMRTEYAALVRTGRWFTPGREALDASNAKLQEQVNGVVGVRLLKGQQTVTV